MRHRCVLMYIGIVFLALFSDNMIGVAQSSNIGTPPISNFYNQTYKGSPQNWDIAQHKKGLLYFANSDGLLEFDGINWRCYKVSNQTIVRSVEVSEDGKIFVGAQGELGYFYGNEVGVLFYHSLKHLLPMQEQSFADIWDIEIVADRVFFSSGNIIFLYQNGSLSIIYSASQSLHNLTKIGKDIYLNDNEKGLLKYNGKTFLPLLSEPYFTQQEVSGLFPFGQDTLLVSTVENGLFLMANKQVMPWKVNGYDVFKKSRIYTAKKIDESNFAFGTSTQGVYIVNKSGQVTHHINRKKGLQVNNVLCLFTDQSKNLWVGLDNGIDFIETSSPFTNISPDRDLKSMGYSIQIYEDQIYFGTASGVYTNDWTYYYNPIENSDYKLVKNTKGQVWNLSLHKNDLLLNHHEGTFVVKDNIATKIPAKNGAWMQLPVGGNKFLSGHYNGLLLLEKEKEWKVSTDFQNDWRESCRFIVSDRKGNIWVSHPYRGLFKLRFNNDFSKLEKIQSYNAKDGFPSDLHIYVFKIGEEPVFCAEQGVFAYNEEKDRFEPDENWNAIFGKEIRVKRLIEAPNGDIWFVTNEEVGVLEVNDAGIYKKINKKKLPQLKDKLVNSFETIYPYNEENVFIAHEEGFIHYNPLQTSIDTHFNVLIRQVQILHNDSLLYGGNAAMDQEIPLIDYESNGLRIGFAATNFGNFENNLFQYYLEGYDEKWLAWNEKSQIEYTNLSAGNYTFHVRAKNISGLISKETTYGFEILSPWYASRLAFLIYAFLIGSLFFSLIFFPKKRFDREKAALQSEQEKTLLQKDQEYQLIEQKRKQQISQLEKDKLELDIKSKNQELASSTMHIVQKIEALRKIKEDIQKIAKASTDKFTTEQLEKITRNISADQKLDDDWEQFAKHFDQVHSQFLQSIRLLYPQLTTKDHRLCAYLRMNLSSKEMASLMNISVRSVEVARYRLRKKLEIDSEVNLVEFMLKV